jgi:HK97 gp10 family phage protein
MTMRIKVDTAGLSSLIQQMNENVNGAVRPAAQAAAQVLYDNVKSNVSRIGKVTGNLQNSIYQVYSKKNSSETKATYEVSYNKQKAPHGHLVEYGHIQKFRSYIGKDGKWYTNKKSPLAQPIQIAAKPFIRPAITQFNAAMDAAKDRLIEELNKDYT